ncbi:cytochrome b/b6 domain-containing protein [Brevundimonas sp. SL130]|uniref:cytochrome b/b6 domain-containing protein n=1 Tax=Brevundimonas sp. SL130 TaxID=2995143 RepID=UPI00226D33E4|nr:cytochrome b/b6 domain-containing protein [Brevundimonas sp. SL130]WAC58513.1 cytochrome b/b6 domain-containing protein [Brevundimonas sp. SL130]
MAPTRYSAVAIALHWVIALCILSMIPMGLWMTAAIEQPDSQALAYRVFQIHKSIGFLILALTVVRIVWRLTHRPPALPGGMKRWEGFAANATHVAFYALMLALPLTGWLYVSTGWAVALDRALEVATSWFGLFPIPHLPGVAELSASVRRTLAFQAMGAHAAMAWGAVALIALHIGAALKHQFLDHDGVLAHMVPFLKPAEGHASATAPKTSPASPWVERGVGVALIAVVAMAGAVAARPDPKPSLDMSRTAPPAAAPTPVSAPETAPETAADPVAEEAPAETAVEAGVWTINRAASSIAFGGTQSGDAFKGRFEQWTGQIRFDPQDLAGSKAVITVQTNSARTGDATQEGSLQGAEWFDPAQYPTARFETTGFRALGGDRYQATGTLRVKTTTLRVVLPFTFSEADGVATVAGRLELDRTALNIGMESDATGDWVSKMIDVQIKVSARRAG